MTDRDSDREEATDLRARADKEEITDRDTPLIASPASLRALRAGSGYPVQITVSSSSLVVHSVRRARAPPGIDQNRLRPCIPVQHKKKQ